MNIYQLPISLETHIVISDPDSGKVLCEGSNAIHPENMSTAFARALSRDIGFFISEMHFGNGASITGTDGAITYKKPNISGQDATLHNSTYFRVVDDSDANNPDASSNKVTISHTNGTGYADTTIVATLDYADPAADDSVFNIIDNTQQSLDATTSVTGEMVFDEIGLKTRGISGLNSGNLLTHFIFHPVEKQSNQRIQVAYTLRVRAG
jgi:hypothetical protein